MNWEDYTKDLNIPKTWVCTSYGNDALPSYTSGEGDFGEPNYEAYHIWIDSLDTEERKANSKDIYGLDDELAPRFHVVLCYGHSDNAFYSDDFDAVVKWINDNPKTLDQIKETKEYI
tara:strand:- start:1998 stop:2348 length:351 start_codon:yes stop_codon:yes gene_type:complete